MYSGINFTFLSTFLSCLNTFTEKSGFCRSNFPIWFQRDRKLYAGNIKVVQLLSIMRRSIRILDNWFSNVRKTVKEILGVFALDIHRCFLVLDIFRQRRIRRPSDHVEGGYIELTFQDTIETEPGPTTLMKVEQMFDTITSFVNLFMNIRTLKYYGRGRT